MDDIPPTRAPSATDALAAHLKSAISEGKYSVGTALPSEREMMERFGVSRTVVREALRALAGQGLIEVKRGRSGGSYITKPKESDVVSSLNFYLNGKDIRLVDLVYARLAIEPLAAAQAAVMRSADALEELRVASVDCENAFDDLPAFVDANLRWHMAVANASNNPMFVTFLRSIYSAMHDATDLEGLDTRMRKAVVGVHWQIYHAILQQDPDAARRRMERHMQAYRDALTSAEHSLRSKANLNSL